jgi:hypothetical protein
MEEAVPRREPQALGLALRDLLNADAKLLRRAIESRGDGDGGTIAAKSSSKGAKHIQHLAGSLEALASFVSARPWELNGPADRDAVDPVVDPLLECIVRPSGGGGGAGARPQGCRAYYRR